MTVQIVLEDNAIVVFSTIQVLQHSVFILVSDKHFVSPVFVKWHTL